MISCNTLIKGFYRDGRIEDALRVLCGMRLNGPSPDSRTYSILIDNVCQHSNASMGLCLIQEMLWIGLVPSAVAYNCVLAGLRWESR